MQPPPRRLRPARLVLTVGLAAVGLYAALALLVAALCPQDVRTAVIAHRVLPEVREADAEHPPADANRALVRVTGETTSPRPVSDRAFGIETNAVALVRVAEMCQ